MEPTADCPKHSKEGGGVAFTDAAPLQEYILSRAPNTQHQGAGQGGQEGAGQGLHTGCPVKRFTPLKLIW